MKKKTHSSETSRCRHFLSKVTRVSELRAGGRYCRSVLSPYSMTVETFGTYVNRLSAWWTGLSRLWRSTTSMMTWTCRPFEDLGSLGSTSRKNVTCSDFGRGDIFRDVSRIFSLSHLYRWHSKANENEIRSFVITRPMRGVRWERSISAERFEHGTWLSNGLVPQTVHHCQHRTYQPLIASVSPGISGEVESIYNWRRFVVAWMVVTSRMPRNASSTCHVTYCFRLVLAQLSTRTYALPYELLFLGHWLALYRTGKLDHNCVLKVFT
jgi:hypothetical protein